MINFRTTNSSLINVLMFYEFLGNLESTDKLIASDSLMQRSRLS